MVPEVALMNAVTYCSISTEGSGLVPQILQKWVCCGWRAISEALIEVNQIMEAWYLLPPRNHRPGFTGYPLFAALIKLVSYGLERGTRYQTHAYASIFGPKAREHDFRNWDAGMLYNKRHRGFFAISYTFSILKTRVLS